MDAEEKAFDLLEVGLSNLTSDAEVKDMLNANTEVYQRFASVFSLDGHNFLDEIEVRAFLDFKNNKHWTSLHRASGPLFDDFENTKEHLIRLLSPTSKLEDRLNSIVPLKGMGHGIATAILHVSDPNRFGVWNNTSEHALRQLGLFPVFERGQTLGEKYAVINRHLLDFAARLETSLWVLDSLFWYVRESGLLPEKPLGALIKAAIDGRERSIATIVYTVGETVKRANGQLVEAKKKNKELRMSTYELDAEVRRLLAKEGDRCAITGLTFEFEGDGTNSHLRPSLDRVDSDGHYEIGNLQLVCRFINFWKGAMGDAEFRSLLKFCAREAPNLR